MLFFKKKKKRHSNYFLTDSLKDEINKNLAIVGKWSYSTSPLKIYRWNDSKIYIGNFCSIGPEVKIIIGGTHRIDWVSTAQINAGTFNFNDNFLKAQKIKDFKNSIEDLHIENDVWIGAFSIIYSGVKLGNGSVVAAGSVVTKDVDPYTVVGGNPAKFIKWWELDDKKIDTLSKYLLNENVDLFIKKFKTLKYDKKNKI